MVRGLFSPCFQSEILNTSIGERGPDDLKVWRYEDKGEFTVKSAYLCELGFYDSHAHTSKSNRKVWSRGVWSVPVPPKIRVFLWRAFNNLIPTAANLRQHHVPVDGICSLCKDRWASTEHCLLFCPRVMGVWKTYRFYGILKRAKGLTIMDYSLWAVLLWSVWGYICKMLHPQVEPAEIQSEASSMALLEASQAARPTLEHVARLGVELGAMKWIKPQRGRLRMDVDAHVDMAARVFGVGMVVRNHEGRLVAAKLLPSSTPSSVMMAEIMAVIQGAVFCVEQDLAPVEIFTDSFLAARTMADPDEEEQLLPSDICDMIRVARDSCLIGVSHMYRTANLVAHSLASRAAVSPRAMS